VGLPGVGKTAMAMELVNHTAVRNHFKDGVLWAGLGQAANPLHNVSQWADALGQDLSSLGNEDQRAQAVADAIGERHVLLVIDDAWDIDSASPLRCGGLNCCHLLTTRDNWVARIFASSDPVLTLPTLNEEAAYEMLIRLAPEACEADPAKARDLARAVGGLPLALGLLAGYLSAPHRSMFSTLSENAFKDMMDPIKRLQLAEKRLGTIGGAKVTLETTVALSLYGLPQDAITAFYSLGAFAPKPAQFRLEAAKRVTEVDESIIAMLVSRNLLERVAYRQQPAQPGSLSFSETLTESFFLHQVVFDVAQNKVDATAIARHRNYYLSLIETTQREKSWEAVYLIDDIFEQIRRAWSLAPEDAFLFEWLAKVRPYFARFGLWTEDVAWTNRALGAAIHLNRREDEAYLLTDLGFAYHSLKQWDKAIDASLRASVICEDIGDYASLGRTLHNISLYFHMLKDKHKAGEYFQRSWNLLNEQDDFLGMSSLLVHLSSWLRESGRLEEAAEVGASFDEIDEAKREAEKGEHYRSKQETLERVLLANTFSTKNRPLPLLVAEYHLAKPNLADFGGVLVMGVKLPKRVRDEETFTFLRCTFSPGERPETEYLDYRPYDSDLFVLLTEGRAFSLFIPPYGSVGDEGILEIDGDLDLLDKFGDYIAMPEAEATAIDGAANEEVSRLFHSLKEGGTLAAAEWDVLSPTQKRKFQELLRAELHRNEDAAVLGALTVFDDVCDQMPAIMLKPFCNIFIQLCKSDNKEIRATASWQLRFYHDTDILDEPLRILLHLLDDPCDEVVNNALGSLGFLIEMFYYYKYHEPQYHESGSGYKRSLPPWIGTESLWTVIRAKVNKLFETADAEEKIDSALFFYSKAYTPHLEEDSLAELLAKVLASLDNVSVKVKERAMWSITEMVAKFSEREYYSVLEKVDDFYLKSSPKLQGEALKFYAMSALCQQLNTENVRRFVKRMLECIDFEEFPIRYDALSSLVIMADKVPLSEHQAVLDKVVRIWQGDHRYSNETAKVVQRYQGDIPDQIRRQIEQAGKPV
jgi:tetratricopeptide (TPR) repeat protein